MPQIFADDNRYINLRFFNSNIFIDFSSIKRVMFAKRESGQLSYDPILSPNLKSVRQMDSVCDDTQNMNETKTFFGHQIFLIPNPILFWIPNFFESHTFF